MADAIDDANELAEQHLAHSLAAARVPVPAGEPGECQQCGEDSKRLIGGRCAPCRDGRNRR
ncbi:conjugal transfer protein TraR [Sphingomonas sp. T9W2]|uniref:conjugal transfer protein TraR n=1 Tax=Sphingomonas sp. T9W2 TaxID=3143183 RepID=UPI0031F582AB